MNQIEISRDVYEAHRKLSRCSLEFLEFVEVHPTIMKRSNFDALLSDKRFSQCRFQSWPTFVNQRTKKEMTEAVVRVYDLIKSIPGRLFDYDPRKISRYYGIPEDESQWMLYGVYDSYIHHLLARGDFIFSPSAGLKCVEFNILANLGGWQIDLLEPLYINNPVISDFLEKYNVRLCKNRFFPILLEHIGKHALERFGHSSGDEINIAIVSPEYSGKEYHLDYLLTNLAKNFYFWQKNHAVKGELIGCDLDHLQIVDNCVMFRDKRIHILIETYIGKMPFRILDTVKSKNLLIYNGPVGLLLSHKLNLALLSEYQNLDIFTSEEKEAIREYIPWTRKIVPGFTTYGTGRVKLEEFIVSNRERLVIKSGTGYGGYEVFVGFSTSPGQWKQQMKKAFQEKNWVVQEYIPSFSYLYQVGESGCAPHNAVWGLFIFGSRYAGGFVRILPKKGGTVINYHQGANESIILEVDE